MRLPPLSNLAATAPHSFSFIRVLPTSSFKCCSHFSIARMCSGFLSKALSFSDYITGMQVNGCGASESTFLTLTALSLNPGPPSDFDLLPCCPTVSMENIQI